MVQQIIQGLLSVKSSSLKLFQTSVPNNTSSLDFFISNSSFWIPTLNNILIFHV